MRYDRQLDIFTGADDSYNPRDAAQFRTSNFYWQAQGIDTNHIHRQFEPWFRIGNNEVAYLTHILANNPITMGMIITKCDILRGKRLALFDKREVDSKTGKHALVELSEVAEIEDFYEYNELNQWAYDSFFHHEITGNAFSEGIFSIGSSNAPKKLVELGGITPECVRAVRDKGVRKRVKEYGVSDRWTYNLVQKHVSRIPAFHWKDFYSKNRQFDPGKAGKSVMFHAMRHIPLFPIYAIPRWYGARHWLETQNLVPIMHKNNLANLFGLRMQIHVSRALVERMRRERKDDEGNELSDQQILEIIAKDASKWFTNPSNAGKSIATAYETDEKGNMIKDMSFEKIDVNLNDDAYSKLDNMMSQSVTSSMGTSPSLAGIITKQNLPSGSEQRYAWNIEVVKGAYLRDLILQPLRFAHKFNQWPDYLEWGFEQDVMVRADEDKSGVKSENSPASEEDDDTI